MVAQMQMQVPLESILFAFKFRDNAPYRYYDADKMEYSAPGYLAQILNFMNPTEEWQILQEQGYTKLLDGTVEILVLDRLRCSVSDAGETLKRLALRMN